MAGGIVMPKSVWKECKDCDEQFPKDYSYCPHCQDVLVIGDTPRYLRPSATRNLTDKEADDCFGMIMEAGERQRDLTSMHERALTEQLCQRLRSRP